MQEVRMQEMTVQQILILICASAAAALLTGCAPQDKTTTADAPRPQRDAQTPAWPTLSGAPPLIIAHRGASGYRPEHTLEAYQLAIEMGADVIEPDLVLTKDGVLVARHDRYLSTTTNVADKPAFAARKRANPDPSGEAREDWWIEDFTLAELKTLRARQPRDARSKEFDGHFMIPTFDEILTLAASPAQTRGRPVGVYPETKHPEYFASIGLDFEAPLLAALENFDAGPVFIQSFEPDILKRLKGKTRATLVQLVYQETPGAGSNIPLADIAEYATAVGPSKDLILAPSGVFTDFIVRAHDLSLQVHPWTFRNDQPNPAVKNAITVKFEHKYPNAVLSEYAIFFNNGVDGVFTDFPDTAVNAKDAYSDLRRAK